MAKILVDLDLVNGGQRSKSGGGEAGQSSIRTQALHGVLRKLVEYPVPEDEEKNPFSQTGRPLALNVMAGRSHDTILISARRGDGKTTFLTDILRLIEDEKNHHSLTGIKGIDTQSLSKIYSLGIIDPTLVETKQNIVIIVIEKIKLAVDTYYRHNTSSKEGEYKDFKRALLELASGLTLLDGIGDSAIYGKEWADADYILDQGLEKAKSAGEFERSFYAYISKACKFLGKESFVIAIDDVDTSFDRGWPVLEALRKYFATPRLKVLMAGDLRLYTLLVRQQQWKHIGNDFFGIEQKIAGSGSYADQLVNMVDILQDQYLVKIVRPENRFELRSFLHLANNNDVLFSGKWSESKPELKEGEVVKIISKELLGITASIDVALIRATLFRLPLRSLLQVIAGAWGVVNKTDSLLEDDRERATNILAHVASAALMGLDLNEHELTDPESTQVFGALILWLTKNQLWLSMSRFHPGSVDEAKDLVSIRIATRLVELFRREPSAVFDYWLKLCVIREKLDSGELYISSTNQQFEGDSKNDLRVFLEHINVSATERITQFVSRIGAWDAGQGRQINRGIRLSGASVSAATRLSEMGAASMYLYGINITDSNASKWRDFFQKKIAANQEQGLLSALPAPLRGYHKALIDAGWDYSSRRGTEAGFISVFANTLTSLRYGLDKESSIIAMLPASLIVSGQGAENGSYSVLRLIATITEIFQVGSAESKENSTQRLELLLQGLALFRSYPSPAAVTLVKKDETVDEEDDPTADGNDDDQDNNEATDLLALLRAWIKGLKLNEQPIIVSPLTLARIWTRFTYTFDDIVKELKLTETRYLGVLMHRSITAFLHSIGIECLRAKDVYVGKRAGNNAITSSLPLLDILNTPQLKQTENPDFKLFWAIFSCPLWGYFLARSGKDITDEPDRENATEKVFSCYQDEVTRISDKKPNYEVKFKRGEKIAQFEGLYFLLNSVPLQGSSQQRKTHTPSGTNLFNVLTNPQTAAGSTSPLRRGRPKGSGGTTNATSAPDSEG